MSDALLPNADCFEQSSKIAADQPIEADAVAFGEIHEIIMVHGQRGLDVRLRQSALDRQQPNAGADGALVAIQRRANSRIDGSGTSGGCSHH